MLRGLNRAGLDFLGQGTPGAELAARGELDIDFAVGAFWTFSFNFHCMMG